jgi:hypothetical protein
MSANPSKGREAFRISGPPVPFRDGDGGVVHTVDVVDNVRYYATEMEAKLNRKLGEIIEKIDDYQGEYSD